MLKVIFFQLFLFIQLAAFEPYPVTPYPVVGLQTLSFLDKNRDKTREILLWYPVSSRTFGEYSDSPWDIFKVAPLAPPRDGNRKMPVVVISHGYTGNPHQLSWLIRSLVHAGYVVMSIQHLDLVEGKAHVNHWERARDVKMMIDQLASSSFSKFVDLEKIGIGGFSLGGTTAVWVAGGRSTKLDSLVPSPAFAAEEDYVMSDQALPTLNKEMMAADWRDSRVKAAFVMAPAWAWLFDESSLNKVTIPTYFIAAEADSILVTKQNAGFFARNTPGSVFQEIPGKVDHYVFISALSIISRQRADPIRELDFLFEDDDSIDRQWIQSEVVEEAVRFFNSALLGQS